MPPTDELIQNLRAEIAHGRVLAILGSGVSIAATKGHPHASWIGLIESGIERCLTVAHPLPDGWEERLRQEIHSGDLRHLLAAAQEISCQLGAPDSGEYRRWLRETVGSLPLLDRSVLDALRNLPVTLATTNYDGLLEEVTGLDPVTWRDHSNVERVLRGEAQGIVHFHGFWKEPESVILSLRSYEEISQDAHTQTMLQALRSLRTLLFVGCGDGLADPNFGAFLRWSREIFRTTEPRHFRLCRTGELVQVQAQHPPSERIFALPYGLEHDDLGPFLRSLAPAPVAPATQPSVTPDHHLEPAETHDWPAREEIARHLRYLASSIRQELKAKTYLPLASREVPPGPLTRDKDRDPFVAPIHQVLLELVGRSQGGDSASAQIAAINRRSRVVRNLLRTLDRSTDPLIVLGEPGSGKTMTLQQAALTLARREIQRRSPRAVLYVRLGEFHVERPRRIGPDDVLHFVEQESPPGLRPSIRRLADAGRLVLFFDGMDEMSRDRYGDHTEALSLFAGGSRAKTLFSCRIADFSPGFIHRRLVLLPFDRLRITEFLKQKDYIVAGFPLEIDGHLWTLKALAQRLTRSDLPVQADNPFVLWLLCLYLQEEKTWPVSRVELLRFYTEANYRRKLKEIAEDEPSLPMQTVFQEWARFAYQITERNRGVEIPVGELPAGHDEAEVHAAIRLGKRCGVLAESREGHEHLVRFEHHRFQEYFAACHLHATRLGIDWLGRLDAPRWQETMVNLILLGGEAGATQALADSVGAVTAACLRGAVGEEPKAAWERRGEEPPLRDEEETLLADRVELCSRILRQASAVSAVRDTLMPPFRDAVQLLAERGNPITQVKMMGVSLNLPEIDRIETARKPLQSPIQWVRNQALILLASTPTGETAVGSDLATEMGYDLANGLFLSRYKAYRRAVRKAGDPGHRRTLFAGSLCFALNVLLLCALAVGIYFGARSLRTVTVDFRTINESITRAVDSWPWQRRPPRQPTSANIEAAAPEPNQTFSFRGYEVLSRRDFMKATALLVLLAASVTLTLKPSALWAALPGTSAAVAVLGPVALSPWIASAELGRAFFILTWYFWFPAPFFISLIAAAIHCSSVSLFFATTLRLRHSRHPLGSFLASGWQNCGFGRLFSRRFLYPLLLSILLPFALPILLLVILTLDYLLDLPFSLPTNALLIVGVPFLIALLHPVFQLFRAIPKGQTLRTAGKGLAILLGIVAAAGLFLWLLVPVARWLEGLPPERVARFFVFLIVLTLLIAFTPVYLGLWRALTRPFRMSQAWLLRHRSITQATWEAQFLNADPHQQHLLLSQTDYQTLSLTRLEFLEVLREIRPLINKEPALSTYWDQRERLEKSLRQERQG